MPSLTSPTQSMDTIYPEPLSRLNRRVTPRKRRGGSFRYRTQPVTFSEIQEVDEDNLEDATQQPTCSSKSELELNLLNKKFEEFKRLTEQRNDCYEDRMNDKKLTNTRQSGNRTSF